MRLQCVIPRSAPPSLASSIGSNCDSTFSAPPSDPPSPNAVKEPAPKTPPERHTSLSSFMQDSKSPLDARCSPLEQQTCKQGTATVTALRELFRLPNKSLRVVEEKPVPREAKNASNAELQPVGTSSPTKSISSIYKYASRGPHQCPNFSDWSANANGDFDFSPQTMDPNRSQIRFRERSCSRLDRGSSSYMRYIARCHRETEAEAERVPYYLSKWMLGGLISSLLLAAYMTCLADRG